MLIFNLIIPALRFFLLIETIGESVSNMKYYGQLRIVIKDRIGVAS